MAPPIAAFGTVVACALTPHQRARLSDALRGRAHVHDIDSFAELNQWLRSTVESVDLVLLSPVDREGNDPARAIRQLASDRPRVAIVAFCQAGSQYSTDIRLLAAAGVHQFVFNGIDDTGVALRAVLESARRACAADFVMQQLSPLIPALLQPLVETALARPDSVASVDALAGAAGVHRKTLFNRCERADFLPPAELLAWTRMALVGYLLETTGCTVETIAFQLSFSSKTALRNAIKRYTGFTAIEIRRGGGLACVLEALGRRLRTRHEIPANLHLV